ncbi:TetR/AcrR family transcriptional regulator C-terminal domain-containing protein [Goodfellowiella coeruleoviolacea]|uniref:Tetracyclin repressor, C-terminal all-alpha domain n=1 Tax=Goodfellowiella coeruleoviolacea TaxID=334858 RepID=A0AAE3GIX1_9PSEU|nr:TetR/AcrR family transcriptional regulator C-terminal domain-containing protein [Goodfellowiella coeruleoviolacea]MCP2169000.1 Tetracyclin repressor, C-terminal all-alpha domain [Goodfellowiella coeruleoviolacea]
MFTRHPWLVQVLASYVVYGHSKARHDDHSLAVYETPGFTAAQADQAATAVFTYVLGNATGTAATASLTRRLDQDHTAEEQFHEAMTKAREIAEHYPRLRARLGRAGQGRGASRADIAATTDGATR